ncbi:hypothetical protein DYB36_008090 [Aphanomyces astaci]|uniref:FAD synthase middle domain-containing protein n=2 Tax=Aphanomyces astaci TaxID=112090 RepID=A0A397AFK1_APHAT|nr:hypothetical protein DYB36_008090 [Aphanomyces astaci]
MGTGNGRHDRRVSLCEEVEQTGLAGIGRAKDGHMDAVSENLAAPAVLEMPLDGCFEGADPGMTFDITMMLMSLQLLRILLTTESRQCPFRELSSLGGATLDTNSNYLSKFLFGRGVDVVRISVIPDEEDAKAFDVPLEVHEPTKEALRQYLVADHRGHDLNDDRLRMVTFPQGCDVLTTSTWVPIVKMQNVYVLPGIPRLMKQMIESNVDHFKGIPIHQAIARTKKLEGSIAAPLKAVAKDFPSVMIGSYVNLKEDNVAFEDRAYNVQVTLYSRVGDDIRAALPAAVAAIEGWVHEDVEVA